MRAAGRVLRSLYAELFAAYGPQGWWPLPGRSGRRGFDERGYHPGNVAPPRDRAGRFEVALGAVLTQNTAWTNAERALRALLAAGVRSPADVAARGTRAIARLVRTSGSFRVKARKLEYLASFFDAQGLARAPDRAALLAVWGVGPETADSILLYGFGEPVFVVDAYTRRLLARLGVIAGTEPYGEVQELFCRAIGRNSAVFNEYHALIVRQAKEYCRARPSCSGCPVSGCPSRDGA
ncbi:MAG: DNA repair protein [Spirochaetes bacterium]|nr:DNA repair protein [Spirochaetota bacterium]